MMVKTKHTARKYVRGTSIRASRRGGSDDSQEEQRPCKHAGKRPVIEESSSTESADYEEEMEDEERGVQVVFLSAPVVLEGPPICLLLLPISRMQMVVTYPLRLLNLMCVSSRISPKCPSLHILSSDMMLINLRWLKTLWINSAAQMFRQISTPMLSSQGVSLCTTSLT